MSLFSLNKSETEGKLLPSTNDEHNKLKPFVSALSINRAVTALCLGSLASQTSVRQVILQPCDVMRRQPEAFQPGSTRCSHTEMGLQSELTLCRLHVCNMFM